VLFRSYLTNGYWSNYFDGAGDYLSIASNAANALGSGDFTIQFWFYLTGTTGIGSSGEIGFIGCGIVTASRYTVRLQGTSTRVLSWWLNTPSNNVVGTTSISLNTWYHVALVRSGSASNNVKLYLNGVLESQGTSTYNSPADGIVIGRTYTNLDGEYTNGYLSNMQMVVGSALYTSAFTPPTTPLTAVTNTAVLTCQSNRFIDNSTNAFAITKNGDTSTQSFQPFSPSLQYTSTGFSGSGYFFGASNNLATPSGTCPVINDFSASGWVYRTSVPGYQQTFIAMGLDGPGRVGFFWTGSNFEYNIYGSSTVTIDGSGSMPVGAWTYVVLTRTGSTITLYYNGVLKATVTQGTAFSASSGRAMSWMDGTIGYATNLRFDTAAYSSPTTVPTAPVSYTANTNNLLNFTNAGIFDNAMQTNLVTAGNAQINTSTVKYGTGSMYFDGNGDYLTADAVSQFAFASGNFTIELWVNPATVSAVQYLVDTRDPASTTSAGVQWFVSSSAKFGIYVGTTAVISASTTSLVANVWTHLALVKNGSTWTVYVNGVADATTGTNSTSLTQTYLTVACSCNQRAATTTDKYSGYIDDLRRTIGVARYVGNFTPPVARMPNQ